MKIKSERDFWSGWVFVVVGAVFAIGAMNDSMGLACPAGGACESSLGARFSQLSADPGDGFFPLALGLLLVILGAGVLFKSLTIESEGGDPIGSFAWRPLGAIVAAVAVFGALIEPVGLVATVPVLVVVSSLAGDGLRPRGVLVGAVVLSILSWAIFAWGLKLAIPVWPAFAR